jgi:hypothetical protein
MAIPVYLWLTDDAGNMVKGSVEVKGREGSIEVVELMHAVELDIKNRMFEKHSHLEALYLSYDSFLFMVKAQFIAVKLQTDVSWQRLVSVKILPPVATIL